MNALSTKSNGIRAAQVILVQSVPPDLLPAETVFIDKGSAWHNPFLAIHKDPEEALNRYAYMLAMMPDVLSDIDQLHGKDLMSYTNDEFSHGQLLIKLAAVHYRDRLAWAEQTKSELAPKYAGPPRLKSTASNLAA